MMHDVVSAETRKPPLVAAHRRLAEGFGAALAKSATGRFRVEYSPKVTYLHDGKQHAVSMFDLVTFAQEINRRGYGGFREERNAVVFHLNDAGVRLFRNIGAPKRGRLAKGAAGAPGNPLAERAAAFVERGRIEALNAALRELGLIEDKPSPATGPAIYAENAEQLLVPVLKTLSKGRELFPEIVVEIASQCGLDRSAAKLPFGKSGRTLVDHVRHCADYLLSKGYIDRRANVQGDKFRVNMKGASILQHGPIGGWPAFREIEPASQPNTQIPRRKVDVETLVARVGASSQEKLRVLYLNATRLLADPRKADDHGAAKRIVAMVVDEFARRGAGRSHRASTKDMSCGFAWPATEASSGRARVQFDELGEGMLGFFDYRVGNNGLSTSERHRILDAVFEQELPPVFDPEYMDSWGEPGSPERLHKMARSLAAFARNAKRHQDMDYRAAIEAWEDDLDYLHDEYYTGRFNFAWTRAGMAAVGYGS